MCGEASGRVGRAWEPSWQHVGIGARAGAIAAATAAILVAFGFALFWQCGHAFAATASQPALAAGVEASPGATLRASSYMSETEPNGDFEIANSIQLGVPVRGTFEAYYDDQGGSIGNDWMGEDVFKFTIPESGTLVATIQAIGTTPCDWSLALVKSTWDYLVPMGTHPKGSTSKSTFREDVSAGTYYVRVGPDEEGTSYKTAYELILSFEKSVSKATVSAIPSKTYTGNAIKPTPTVKYLGKTLKQGTDYTLSYKNNVNAGTATVTVTGKGGYTGTKALSFTIARCSIPKTALKLKSSTLQYTGNAIKPSSIVSVAGNALKLGRDYTISYRNNKNVGVAYATAVGKGNYSGSASAYFKIVPKGTQIASLKSVADGSKSGFAVKWAKQTSQTSGYELSWSLSGSFSGAKSCRYAASSKFARKCAVNKAMPKSWRGKRVYVRIRTYKTVSSKTYVSAWSKAKSVVVKKK